LTSAQTAAPELCSFPAGFVRATPSVDILHGAIALTVTVQPQQLV